MQPDLAQALAYLRQREAAVRQRRSLQAARLRTVVDATLQAFRQEHGPFAAWLIGSLAWGEPDDASDVDVVVAGLAADAQVALWRALEQATGRCVDLLDLAALPAGFAARVRAEGVAS